MRLFVVPLICLIFAAFADQQLEEQEILKVLLYDGDNYNSRSSPNVSPVEVKASMFILDISSVDDLKNEFSMDFYFRQQWRDPRLAFNHLETKLPHIRVLHEENVWKPDTFFIEERQGKLHSVIQPNTFLRIFPDGEVFWSIRVSMIFSCNMDFRYYPLDLQKCDIGIESYGSRSNEISYGWSHGNSSVGISDKIDMPGFHVNDLKFKTDLLEYSHGSYSSLQVNLTFRRKVGLFMNKLYVPFVILVIASWLSFWIRAKFTSLRLTLILTILFIMFWLESDINRHTPRVSYTKAVDVWTGVCLSLVFAALLQFILVSQLVKNEKHKKRQNAIDPETLLIKEGKETTKDSNFDRRESEAMSQLIAGNLREGRKLHEKIDIFTRLFYPLVFIAFNLIYWPVYCSGN